MALSTLTYIVSWVRMGFLIRVMKFKVGLLTLTGFLPHVPIYWFWKEVIGDKPQKRSNGIIYDTFFLTIGVVTIHA